jgi:hypothetical protein
MRRPQSSDLELEHQSQSQSICPQTIALVAAGGGDSTLVVERIEPRGYWQPLIGDDGLEEVEVEGSKAARWPVLGDADSVIDPKAVGCPGGTMAGLAMSRQSEAECTSGGKVREIGIMVRVRVFGESLYPAPIGAWLWALQGRLTLGFSGPCRAMLAPTGYMGLWPSLVVPSLMGHVVPGPLGLRRNPGMAQTGLHAGTTHLKSCQAGPFKHGPDGQV